MKIYKYLFSSGGCYICHGQGQLRHGICFHCLSSMNYLGKRLLDKYFYLDEIFITMEYTSLTRDCIKKLKFKEARYFSRVFGDFMAELVLEEGLGDKVDSISFVAMDPRKERIRGYNQAELLARRLAEKTGIACKQVLTKTRRHKDQIGLTGRQRQENVKNSFSSLGKVEGERILLVDDVFTTGSTLVDCGRALKEAGAERVVGLVVSKANFIENR